VGAPLPLLALGFRPFFLLAALLAVVGVPVWVAVFFGWMRLPARLWPNGWHAHEMVFGFVVAVLAGFLLTAVRNWTSRPTPSGPALGALVALWLAGRAAILFDGPLPHAAVAAVDLAFLPVLSVAIAVPIVRAKNWKNLGFVPLLLLVWSANVLFHVGSATWSPRAIRIAIDVVLMVIVLMGGRVIPSFTANALRVTTRQSPLLDWASLSATGLVALLGAVPGWERACGVAALCAGILNGARMLGWRSWATRTSPILWVLHAGYAWLAVGLVLRAVTAFVPGWSETAPLHALTVGAMSTLILGMIARVSLGHTGRMLVVHTAIAVAFGMLTLAAVVRVFGPLLWPEAYRLELVLSAALWTAAFGVFVVVYLPILVSPRVDGKPG
jgi:uncharacterized protein involved in response to NO